MSGEVFANDPDMRAALREPFPKELIGTLPATSKRPALSYVGHAVVTDRLNKTAPDWAFSIERIKESPDGLHVLGIVGIMTLGGKAISEVGEPEHQSVWGPELKLAVSDFIKRGAMRFGVALDLWSKEELTAPEPPKPPADPRIIRGGPFKGQTVGQMAATEEGRAQLAAWIADSSIRPELAEAAATALDLHENPVADTTVGIDAHTVTHTTSVGAGADLQTTDEPEVGEETSGDADSPAEGSEKAEPGITAAQRARIFGIAGSLGWGKEDIYSFASITSLTKLSKLEAGDLIDRMTLAESDQVREGA